MNIHEFIRDGGEQPRKQPRSFRPGPAETPTDARPGSDDRVRVMCERAERGEELFHADDVNVFREGPLRSFADYVFPTLYEEDAD